MMTWPVWEPSFPTPSEGGQLFETLVMAISEFDFVKIKTNEPQSVFYFWNFTIVNEEHQGPWIR